MGEMDQNSMEFCYRMYIGYGGYFFGEYFVDELEDTSDLE
jgi:hypothetical protein